MRALYPTSRTAAAVLFLIAPLFLAVGAPFKTSEERIPNQVAEVVCKQIEGYFVLKEFTGIPLLDPKVEWNDFGNWPDEFTFQGDKYSLRLVDESGGDAIRPLKSRAEVKPGMVILAHYLKKGTNEWWGLIPSAVWIRDGSVWEKGLRFNGKNVFSYKFYPTGALYFFIRDDFTTKEYRIEYFDRKGKLVGVSAVAAGKTRFKYTWKGIKVHEFTFRKREAELLWSGKRYYETKPVP